LLALATWAALSAVLVTNDLFREKAGEGLPGTMGRLLGAAAAWRRGAALAALVGGAVIFLWLYLRRAAPRVYSEAKLIGLLSLLLILGMAAGALLVGGVPLSNMLVVPATTLMAGVLLGAPVAVGVAVVGSVLVSLLGGEELGIFLMTLGASLAALYCASRIWPLYRLMRTAAIMAGANLFLVLAVGLLDGSGWMRLAREGLLAGVFGAGAAAVALAGIFLLQRPFGITTYPWLLELSHPNEALLRRLQEEAPGTYHSSLLVASLAHQAAEAIGADALLARAGALYHDVGKLRRPAFFVENQALLGRGNVHDRLSASLSSLVITSHVRDGIELAKEHKLPPQVVDIVAEHHGSTLVSYFYHRALTRDEDARASEFQFRYPGPRPRSRESAIVMLADSVQAAAQTLADPSQETLRGLTRSLVRDRLEEGQLEECELTLRELAAVTESLGRMLQAMALPSRVEYPPPRAEGGGRGNGDKRGQPPAPASEPAAAEAPPRPGLPT
jgi:hypothetical protein